MQEPGWYVTEGTPISSHKNTFGTEIQDFQDFQEIQDEDRPVTQSLMSESTGFCLVPLCRHTFIWRSNHGPHSS